MSMDTENKKDKSNVGNIAGMICISMIVTLISTGVFCGFGPKVNETIDISTVKAIWDPVDQQVIFIDKDDNMVKLILSKEMTTAVFSLKALSIQSEFDSIVQANATKKR